MTALIPSNLKSLVARLMLAVLAVAMSGSVFGQADACTSDLDGDGIVAGADLALVLGSWGPCKNCDGDVNGDHAVDGVDLAFVLTRWGGKCAPIITAVSPEGGPAVGGVDVTIMGSHLANPSAVRFGTSEATILGSEEDSIRVRLPAQLQGAVAVYVETVGGISHPAQFAYFDPPSVNALSPTFGEPSGGSTVTISGSGFYGAASVTFGGVPAPLVTVISATALTAVTPSGVSGAASVLVSTPSGTAVAPSPFAFVHVPAWSTLLEAMPDPNVVIDGSLRNAITATQLAWRVRHIASGVEMVLVPSGSFAMGCSASLAAQCGRDESPVHAVTLSQPCYLGRFEVTQQQWTTAMGSNPSHFRNFPESPFHPVESVGWNRVQVFLAATGLRLPTEAEWEFACRAGTQTAFHGSSAFPHGTGEDDLAQHIAWFERNSEGRTHVVGTRAANSLGLFDMSGNVAEWVADYYASDFYATSPSVNPIGPPLGNGFRVFRGGYFGSPANELRSSFRSNENPFDTGFTILGFRVAKNP
jgi:formylglycine-generating enzyme required for sulfatase activity